jgi:pteridine reductase
MTTDNKVALITGSAKRIGAFTAEYFHSRGYDIILHYRHSGDAAKSLRDCLNASRPHSCIALHADLADPTAWEQLAEQARSWKHRLDLLVNNASSYYPTEFGKTTQAQWNDLFASNAMAPFFLTQALTPLLQQSNGCVVNIVDINADRPLPNYTPYCMAKAALKAMTLSLAQVLAPQVRVNGIAPGAIIWPTHGQTSEADQQALLARTPMQSMGSPEDIARTIYFLAEKAPFITGQIIAVDGGQSLT